MKEVKYIHEEEVHNLDDPRIIVPLIMKELSPKSVVDVGCGIGTFLHVFKEHGVEELLGLDGDWVNKELLTKHISIDKFKEVDLEKVVKLDRRFDLAVNLEVAEHLKESCADNIVETLTSLSDIVLFSAGIPGQMGQNHINEQWPEYWAEKFKAHGYSFHDVLRPIFWNNIAVPRWYKQNMFVVVKDGKEGFVDNFTKYFENNIFSYAHPEYYTLRVNELKDLTKSNELLRTQLDELNKGKSSLFTYLKLIFKLVLRNLNLYNK